MNTEKHKGKQKQVFQTNLGQARYIFKSIIIYNACKIPSTMTI